MDIGIIASFLFGIVIGIIGLIFMVSVVRSEIIELRSEIRKVIQKLESK